jgi:hypothetical protein
MPRIVIVPVVLALALGGCSNKEQAVNNVVDSPSKAADSMKATTSDTGVKESGETPREVKETAKETSGVIAKSDQKGKEGIKKTKDVHSVAADNWSDFLATVKKCDALSGAENAQCMTDAGATYRSWNFNCEAMAPQDRVQCRTYSERWNTASATSSKPTAPAVRSGEPNIIPADPGDASDKERNRDSTKQQASVPQLPKQN